MKRKYKVTWYQMNLTVPKVRKFFTKVGALIFAAYLEANEYARPIITEV